MDIRQIIESDARIVEIKKEYNVLISKKNMLIMEISLVEGDIIKLQGKYEATAQEIVKPLQAKDMPVEDKTLDEPSEMLGPVSEQVASAETDRPTHDEV